MAQYFPAYEIAEMAMQFEDVGANFYRRLAVRTQDKKVKDIFLKFLAQEVEHKEIFAQLSRSAKENKITAVYSMDFYNSIQAMMVALEEATFKANDKAIAPFDVAKSIDIAIDVEERSVATYKKIHDTLDVHISDVLLKIIEEEKRHLSDLAKVKAYLDSKKRRD